jgi:hypothetical protein
MLSNPKKKTLSICLGVIVASNTLLSASVWNAFFEFELFQVVKESVLLLHGKRQETKEIQALKRNFTQISPKHSMISFDASPSPSPSLSRVAMLEKLSHACTSSKYILILPADDFMLSVDSKEDMLEQLVAALYVMTKEGLQAVYLKQRPTLLPSHSLSVSRSDSKKASVKKKLPPPLSSTIWSIAENPEDMFKVKDDRIRVCLNAPKVWCTNHSSEVIGKHFHVLSDPILMETKLLRELLLKQTGDKSKTKTDSTFVEVWKQHKLRIGWLNGPFLHNATVN